MPAPAAADITPAGAGPAAAVFQCAAKTFILLLYRHLNLAAALTVGQIRVAGNRELAREFAANF